MRVIKFILIFLNCPVLINAQIIADHTVVDKYDDIPEYYINEVKKMWLSVPGESHATAYIFGLELLESQNSKYAVNTQYSGVPESYTTSHLRANNAFWGDFSNPSGWTYSYGEEDWWTNETAIARTKAGISYCKTIGNTISAIGFGWCTDMFYGYIPSNVVDPVYGCYWYGASKESPSGDRCWGLDDADNTITGNVVNLDTYLHATQQYIDYCKENGISTKVFFTTGPVDRNVGEYNQEKGYGAHLKMERIRDYVKADASRILFDYADILCYDNAGNLTTDTWNGHTFPIGAAVNVSPEYVGHITNAGCIRLAKALWWMMARMAGWDGGFTVPVLVSGISITATGGINAISEDKGTLQLNADVTPENASNKSISWSVNNGTGQATISSSGLVSAISNGTVTAIATANDGSGIFGSLSITISNQNTKTPVSRISVFGSGNLNIINSNGGTLQLNVIVAPENASDKSVTWSLINGTGQATITSSGMVTAISNGTITAKATANDGSGIFGTLVITITNQRIPVSGIKIIVIGGILEVNDVNGVLQLTAEIYPESASNQNVVWSVENTTGQATISQAGLLTAVKEGIVIVTASSLDDPGISDTVEIKIKFNDTSLFNIIADRNKIKVVLGDDFTDSKLTLFDLHGRVILSRIISDNIIFLSPDNLPSGVYIIVMSKFSIIKTGKIVLIPY